MDRRSFVTLLTTCMVLRNINLSYAAEINDFNKLLASVTPQQIIDAKQYKEFEAGRIFGAEANGDMKGNRSDLPISANALNLIVLFEVTNEENYRNNLIHPTWPGGESGATCGIGFDLGYGDDASVTRAWSNYLPPVSVAKLASCSRITGEKANQCTKQIRDVVVPWEAAIAQFKYYLPFVVAQTLYSFKNLEILSPDSRGALVSLVFNRGNDISTKDSRIEMYNIANLMKNKQFEKIPDQILNMKRLWKAKDQRGLLIRRNLEADLFKIGLEKA